MKLSLAKIPPHALSKAKSQHFFILILLALTWGGSFILMKKGLRDDDNSPVFTAPQLAALRLSIASLVLLPVSIRALKVIRLADLKWIAVVGILGSGIPAFLFTTAQTHLDSGISGILNSLTPLFTLLVGLFVFRRKFNGSQVAGVIIGLLGAALLITLKQMDGRNDWPYAFLIVIATLSYGISISTIPARLGHVHSLHISALSLLISGIPCSIYVFWSDAHLVPITHPSGWESLGYVFTLACLGTAAASFFYFKLAQETSALFASSVAYLMPIVAVGWGVADHEVITWKHLACAAIIIAGVYLVNRGKKG